MFEASNQFLFFDYFRVPYSVTGDSEPPRSVAATSQSVDWVRRDSDSPALIWPREPRGSVRELRLGGVPVFARVSGDEPVGDARAWEPHLEVTDPDGRMLASVFRAEDGSILLPFAPAEAIGNLWRESYRVQRGTAAKRLVKGLALRTYYRTRPFLPRRAQIGLRRAFTRLQGRTQFPRWPVETALHDLYDLLFGFVTEIAGDRVPWIAPWPHGKSWALVLTHDVETEVGFRNIDVLRSVEARHGYRSSWNLVPRRYSVDDAVVESLWDGGWEVGVHGLYHDGRDLESPATFRERLPAMQEAGRRWRSVGFRSPATHRKWELMPLLGFDYDSSYPDTDPYEPQAGGCCSWLPFFIEDLVELPVTLPQDHTLFVILGSGDETTWLQKASLLRERGGMALLITHPDYMLEEHWADVYSRFLEAFATDDSAWRALPREVSAWWRARAESRLEAADGDWRISGPAAADGRVVFTEPRGR